MVERASNGTVLLGALWLALSGCPGPSDSAPDSQAPQWQPADTVVLLTVDTLVGRIADGNGQGWEVMPHTQAMLDQGVSFPHAVAAMGVTGPSLATVTTGTYPREHGKRANHNPNLRRPTLAEYFEAAGYTTWSYSANKCEIMEVGSDLHRCSTTAGLQPNSLADQDAWLIEQLEVDLPTLDPDTPLFIWVHLNQAHTPYVPVDDYYQQFHPQAYTGEIDARDTDMLDRITLEHLPYSAEDALHVEATYASALRQVDGNTQTFLDLLDVSGRLDDVVLAWGGDHAEELHLHNDYFFHGCSPYNAVYEVPWGFWAPQRLPAGLEFDTRISLTDVAPTLVELAAAGDPSQLHSGRSLVSGMLADDLPSVPVFFERGYDTVSVIDGDDKLVLATIDEYATCLPYDGTGQFFETELTELYDLAADPDELSNQAQADPTLRDALKTTVCGWVTQEDWIENPQQQATNELVALCEAWVEGQGD